MATNLSDRLVMARHEGFVGRATERTLFWSTLKARELPFQVMYVFGPGGIGKTALLGEFAFICAELGVPVVRVDGRSIQPSPSSFLEALGLAMKASAQESPLDAMASCPGIYVLLLDTFEMLAPLEAWLTETFLPDLPQNVLVVLAGREPPSTAWRADPGWQSVVRTVPLRNLTTEESRELLTKRRIPAEQYHSALQFTHGHPLAVSLVADVIAQRPNTSVQPESEPDVIRVLLEHLVQRAPGPAHRRALEVCALVHVTTEGLLAKMLEVPDAHELFDWLRRLSIIELGPLGIFPHDIAREVLNADLRWRDPVWFTEIHRRARHHYLMRLNETQGTEQQRVLFDYIFLHRDNPVVKPFFEWQETGRALIEPARPQDRYEIVQMVAEHEGEESSGLAEFWLGRQPGGFVVFRGPQGELAGFVAMVSLSKASSTDIEEDPAAIAAWTYLQQRTPLRRGEAATLFRFWMAKDTYQSVSSIQSLIFVNVVRHYLTSPGLAFTFFPCAAPDFWASVFAYADLERIPGADFQVGGRRYGVYGHDWRIRPPLAWLELLGERETRDIVDMEPPVQTREAMLVLSQPDFEAAVRQALRNISQPKALESNPLLRSRLVIERAGLNADTSRRVTKLQEILRSAVETLAHSTRERRFYLALYHTYLDPAPTQEQASETLNIPFSTFRRHLRSGVERVTEVLWELEIRG